jgi:hypothetical protein
MNLITNDALAYPKDVKDKFWDNSHKYEVGHDRFQKPKVSSALSLTLMNYC